MKLSEIMDALGPDEEVTFRRRQIDGMWTVMLWGRVGNSWPIAHGNEAEACEQLRAWIETRKAERT